MTAAIVDIARVAWGEPAATDGERRANVVRALVSRGYDLAPCYDEDHAAHGFARTVAIVIEPRRQIFVRRDMSSGAIWTIEATV